MKLSANQLVGRPYPFGAFVVGAIGLMILGACSNTTSPAQSSGSSGGGSSGSSGSGGSGSSSGGGSGSSGSGGSGAATGSSTGSASGSSGTSSGTTAATGSTQSGATPEGGAAEASTEASTPCAGPGYAMQFQSQHPDLLQANIPMLPVGTASRTIELWAYFDGTGNSWLDEHGLFETGDRNNPNGSSCHEFALNSTALTGTLAMLHPYGNCDAVDNFFNVPDGDLVMDKGWIHISFGYDSASGSMLFTINGDGTLDIGTGNGASGRTHPETNWKPTGWSTTSYLPADATSFGQNNPGGNLLSIGTTPQFAGPTGWGGKIDEFRVWSVFLTADQVKANMYTIMNGDEPGLVAYNKFDENAGMVVHDSTQPAGSMTNAAIMTPWNGQNPPLTAPTFVPSDIPGTFKCGE
jgi:hypothetical protein